MNIRKFVSALVVANGFIVLIAAFGVLFAANMDYREPAPVRIESIDDEWSKPYNPEYIAIVLAEAMVRAELPKNKQAAFDFGLRHGVLTKKEKMEINKKIKILNAWK